MADRQQLLTNALGAATGAAECLQGVVKQGSVLGMSQADSIAWAQASALTAIAFALLAEGQSCHT